MVKRDRPGQLGNRLQLALVREAAYIVKEGIADVEGVDLVAKNGFGLRVPACGIFEHQDAVDLDMAIGILDYVAEELYNLPKTPNLYRPKVAYGDLGRQDWPGFLRPIQEIDRQVKTLRDRFVMGVDWSARIDDLAAYLAVLRGQRNQGAATAELGRPHQPPADQIS
jgi:3-hydroxybutyryl-CoA dehydrogenase